MLIPHLFCTSFHVITKSLRSSPQLLNLAWCKSLALSCPDHDLIDIELDVLRMYDYGETRLIDMICDVRVFIQWHPICVEVWIIFNEVPGHPIDVVPELSTTVSLKKLLIRAV